MGGMGRRRVLGRLPLAWVLERRWALGGRVGNPLIQQRAQGIQGIQSQKLRVGLGLRVQQDESPRENQYSRS